MNNTPRISRPVFLFYLLVIYVLFQFSWWAYLLIELNKEVYQYRIALLHFEHEDLAAIHAAEKAFSANLDKRWSMILGEGLVFLGLLLFGIWQIRQALKREFQLARQQKNFLLSVTHEFKSPLAAIKLNLQTLRFRNLDDNQRDTLFNRALVETDRIHLLVENALLAARLENHSYELYSEPINLSDFLSQAVKDYQSRIEVTNELKKDITSGIIIRGDQLAIHSMINNLIENAQKYSSTGSSITVSLHKQHAEAIIKIADEGVGIPDKEKAKIFEKFYRVGNEETRRSKGTGLGLYIVDHIVKLHKGHIAVHNNGAVGTVFEIRLPMEVG